MKKERMTLKQALIKYNHIQDITIYFYRGRDYTIFESLDRTQSLDRLSFLKRILVRLNENKMSEVVIYEYIAEDEIRSVAIRVGYEAEPNKQFRDRYRKEEAK